jgi:hydroxymethylglutaryl-CoA lyase
MTIDRAAKTVEIVEVSPRDGLQAHPTFVPTAWKVELVRRIEASGLRRAEVVSFVNPNRVAQMRDAEAVASATASFHTLTRIGLVLNARGLDRALEAEVDEINFAIPASETFCRRNQGVSVAEAVGDWSAIARRSRAAGLPVSVTVSAAFGCPFEGDLDERLVLDLVYRVAEAGPIEIALADTIGAAVPSMVSEMVGEASTKTGMKLRCHFHDTRNTGVANAIAALDAGAEALDASLGGLGGCPFAPGATGNVATEDLVWCLERMGYATGVNLESALETVMWMKGSLDAVVGGAVARAGVFPGHRLREDD